MRTFSTAELPSRTALAVLLVAAAAGAGGAQGSGTAVPAAADSKTIAHVLNRLGFGPAPGDIDRVRRAGLAAHIERQLHPERIPDARMATRLAGFETLEMSTRQLAEVYYLPALMQRREAKRTENAAAADPEMRPEMREPRKETRGQPNPEPTQRRMLEELMQQKVLRAAYSERQLQEVMVDFWFNHFNVFAGKGPVGLHLTAYERDAIRPRVFGKFRDLLSAVAESPAMLFYLDNWQSAAEASAEASGAMRRPGGTLRRPQALAPQAQNRRRGINENYARELMELHTLGVDGGYTQKDVQEIARAFTGWTIDMPRRGGGFRFDPRIHDNGGKTILGVRIPPGGGKSDGEKVLDLLARHPSTARFISTKLARRFVADEPPKALVDRAAARFRETDGDIREVVRLIVTSPEFFAPAAYRVKVKTPLEFVASALRASGTEVQNARPVVQAMRQLGMPLYMCQPPTGYADQASAWVNTGALLSRMNFALMLSGDRLRDGSPVARVSQEQIASDVLAGEVSQTTRETVGKARSEPQKIALLLGSPDFQKR
jgi:uncharacterized protein (DUF1800 family)